MPISPFVFVSSKPTLIPSIVFTVLFLFASCLHFYRTIQTRRRVYIILFIFSFFRTILFTTRIIWSQNIESVGFAITSGILTSGGFFIIVLAVYTLLRDWILTLTSASRMIINNSNVPQRSIRLTKYERYTLNTIEFLLPAFSTLFVVGSIQEFDSETPNTTTQQGFDIMKVAVLCFLISIILYMILVTYFALKYSNRPIHLQLKVLILYTVGALLLIELVYGTLMVFSPSTEKISQYSWVFYMFEPLPEFLILIILGGVILGEWFFAEEDNELVESIKTVSIGSTGV